MTAKIYFEVPTGCKKQEILSKVPVKRRLNEIGLKYNGLTRIYFNSVQYSIIFQVMFHIFLRVPSSLNYLCTVRFSCCFQENSYCNKIMKLLRYAENLNTLFINFNQDTADALFLSLYNLVSFRPNKLNIKIPDIYDNTIEKLEKLKKIGYLLQTITLNCKTWFFTSTYVKSYDLYSRMFLTAADMISRRNKGDKPNIYLGAYLLPGYLSGFSKYSDLCEVGGFRLHRTISRQEAEKSIVYVKNEHDF